MGSASNFFDSASVVVIQSLTITTANISDISTSGAASGNILTYNGSTEKWEPGTGVTGATISSGTWTPAVRIGGSATGITYFTQSGHYVKIGDVVTLWGRVVFSSKGVGVGSITVYGVPFQAASKLPANEEAVGNVGTRQNWSVGVEDVHLEMINSVDYFRLYAMDAASASQRFVSAGDITSQSIMTFHVSYVTS